MAAVGRRVWRAVPGAGNGLRSDRGGGRDPVRAGAARHEDAARDGVCQVVPRSFVDAAIGNGATRASVQATVGAIVGEHARTARRMDQAVNDGTGQLHDALAGAWRTNSAGTGPPRSRPRLG